MRLRYFALAVAIVSCGIITIMMTYDPTKPRPLTPPDMVLQTHADRIYWSNDGNSLISINDEAVLVWDVSAENPAAVELISDLQHDVSAVAWSPSDRMIAIGYDNGDIEIYDALGQRLTARYALNTEWIRTLEWNPDETVFAASDVDEGKQYRFADSLDEAVALLEPRN